MGGDRQGSDRAVQEADASGLDQEVGRGWGGGPGADSAAQGRGMRRLGSEQGGRAALLRIPSTHWSLGLLCECTSWPGRSGVGPELLHF